MSDGTMGDDVYQPDPDGDQVDDSGMLDPEDTLLNRGVRDALDEGFSPPERPLGAEHYGITADEQRRGESLDQRLAEEVPELPSGEDDGDDDLGDLSDTDGELRDGEVGDARSGRLVAPGEGAHDEHDGMVASDVGIDGSAASAEEAAMHLTDEPED